MTDGEHEEILRLRDRMHTLSNDVHRLLGALQTDVALLKQEMKEMRDDNKALRRGFYTLAFSAVTAALVFALAVFQLIGGH